MTDRDLVAKKLARIATCLSDLRTARIELLRSDLREERFVEHTLQIAIQAALDVASYIVSSDRLGEPSSNRALFATLAQRGVIDLALADRLASMAGFRNILVHGYDDVQIGVVEDIVRNHLGDLDAFIVAAKTRAGF